MSLKYVHEQTYYGLDNHQEENEWRATEVASHPTPQAT